MYSAVKFLVLLVTLIEVNCFTLPTAVINVEQDNDTPIIGVLAEELLYSLEDLYPGMYKSYIAASYVKFVEGAGGRVVPIWVGKERSYYEDIMSKINGVLFPGGAVAFNVTDGYAEAGTHIYEIAKEMNDAGNYFPLWGTCLGFELLTFLSAGGKDHRVPCSSQKQSLPLEFKSDYKTSKMFSEANNAVVSILSNEDVTANFHSYCVTEESLTDVNVQDEWRVMSVNHDSNGLEFISTIESKKYPFYGTQFHPEKNMYEWIPDRNISHTRSAIRANSYFGEFFISETRKNFQSFGDRAEEQKHLIYNFAPTYTGINGSVFEQCYLFTE